MSRKTIFLMGAPSGRLPWNETDLLHTAVPPFHAHNAAKCTLTAADAVKWRVLQGHVAEPVSAQDALFLNPVDLQPKVPGDVLLSQFYEHSMSLQESHYLSGSTHDETTLSLEDSSLLESMSSADSHSVDTCFDFGGEISSLKDIPNAAYLRAIVPQTMSVNLVVAVLGINPPRRVTARSSNQQFDILELVVGDETKAGFGVTFWLTVEDPSRIKANSARDDGYREKLSELRPRDLILIRNVGLAFFQNRVYGQSLKKTMTKVDLIYRDRLDAIDPGGIYSARALSTARREDRLLYKSQDVRNWLMNFVGVKTEDRSGTAVRPLPPDTQ